MLEFQDRPSGLSDSGPTGYRVMKAEGRLINQLTIKDGIVRFDYDGLTRDDWRDTPKTDLNIPYISVLSLPADLELFPSGPSYLTQARHRFPSRALP